MAEPIVLAQICNTIPTCISISDVSITHDISYNISYSNFVSQFYPNSQQRFSILKSTICVDDSNNDISGNFDISGSNTLLQFILDTYVFDLSLNDASELSSCSLVNIYKTVPKLRCLKTYNNCCCVSLTKSEFESYYNDGAGYDEFALSLFIIDENYSSNNDAVTSIVKKKTVTNPDGSTTTTETVCIPPLTVRPIEIKITFHIT